MTEPAEIVAQLREFAGRETIGEDVFGAITVGGEVGDNPVGLLGEHDALKPRVTGDRLAHNQPLAFHAGQYSGGGGPGDAEA